MITLLAASLLAVNVNESITDPPIQAVVFPVGKQQIYMAGQRSTWKEIFRDTNDNITDSIYRLNGQTPPPKRYGPDGKRLPMQAEAISFTIGGETYYDFIYR